MSGVLSRRTVDCPTLREAFARDPNPTKEEQRRLARVCELSARQVDNYFMRNRIKRGIKKVYHDLHTPSQPTQQPTPDDERHPRPVPPSSSSGPLKDVEGDETGSKATTPTPTPTTGRTDARAGPDDEDADADEKHENDRLRPVLRPRQQSVDSMAYSDELTELEDGGEVDVEPDDEDGGEVEGDDDDDADDEAEDEEDGKPLLHRMQEMVSASAGKSKSKSKRRGPTVPYKLRNRSTSTASTSAAAASSAAPHSLLSSPAAIAASDFPNKDGRGFDQHNTTTATNSRPSADVTQRPTLVGPIVPADLFRPPAAAARPRRHSTRLTSTTSDTNTVVVNESGLADVASTPSSDTSAPLPTSLPAAGGPSDRKGSPGQPTPSDSTTEPPVSSRLRRKRKASALEAEDSRRPPRAPLATIPPAALGADASPTERDATGAGRHAKANPRRDNGERRSPMTLRRRGDRHPADKPAGFSPRHTASRAKRSSRAQRPHDDLAPRKSTSTTQLVTTPLPVDVDESSSYAATVMSFEDSFFSGSASPCEDQQDRTRSKPKERSGSQPSLPDSRPVKREIHGDAEDRLDLPSYSEQPVAALTFPSSENPIILDERDVLGDLPMTGEQIKQESERFFVEINLGLRRIEDVPPSYYFLAPDLRDWIRKEKQYHVEEQRQQQRQREHHPAPSSAGQLDSTGASATRMLLRKATNDTLREMQTAADASTLATKIERLIEAKEGNASCQVGPQERETHTTSNVTPKDDAPRGNELYSRGEVFSLTRHPSKLQRELHMTDTPLRPVQQECPTYVDFSAEEPVELPTTSAFAPVDSPSPHHSRSRTRDSSIDSTSTTATVCECSGNDLWETPYTSSSSSHTMHGLCYHTIENALCHSPSLLDNDFDLVYPNVYSANHNKSERYFFDAQLDWPSSSSFATSKQW